MKLSSIFLIFGVVIATLFSAAYFNIELYTYSAILLSVLVLCYLGKKLENIKHIAVILFSLVVIEYVVVSFLFKLNSQGLPAFQTNALIFGTHFLVDLVMLLFLKYRVRFSLRYIRRTNPDNWRAIYMTHADPLLYGIFFAFVLVDLAAFGENIIRNLEYLGVDEAFAKQFWSWGLIYYNYEILKSILLSCVITTLLATIFVERQRPAEAEPEFEAKP
ncbi:MULTISPECIES: hypothetical protein [unclassified Pseudoalteromonas]|uniref:hypothetical protein n=1 Tax=unclassified Pseudoalteromonas TaxID=194690 RepID=UPI001F20CBCD|nr:MULTISPECIES: hypothetical protein [unclassified Pseudoalteromonas]MCF2826026.1 hypothetical protein [Pseudoalteromonas sp. OF5H-5]MCF2831681.1 hypothetical protein [Pseudoalteromonas sp. DL2-H6]MCF2925025.1 hypothetical protein [Pseudoalteromonas sp. DL2-H1]